jgi:hypothetical protein
MISERAALASTLLCLAFLPLMSIRFEQELGVWLMHLQICQQIPVLQERINTAYRDYPFKLSGLYQPNNP